MLDFQLTLDTLKQWEGFLRNHVPVERWPNPLLWSSVAALAGAVLAFWGARLLRTCYVLAFMVIGGMVGVRFAGAGRRGVPLPAPARRGWRAPSTGSRPRPPPPVTLEAGSS